ncbi:MAG: NADPH:quinone oxidoreductase family protein [Alcaligenaceae bacterium]|nr:NADPH:quinone oxidoreductase family protein [Alcaligenaceae bacterium]
MKALLCKQLGGPELLSLEDVAPLQPGPGQIVISVKAAGVNFPDTLIIQGKYQMKPDLPFSPGGEVAGTVARVGEGVTQFEVGQRVVAPIGYGGFAEEAIADASRACPLPEGMSFEEASAFVLTYGTSYYALKNRAELKKGETLLILGAAGGVGLAAIQIAKAMGAVVIAAASSEEKRQLCLREGADHVVDYTQEDFRDRLKELTGGKGVDVIYDPVGGSASEPAFRSIAWKGRFLVVGFAAGDIPRIPLNLPLLKGASIVGVFWGAFGRTEPEADAQNMKELFELYAEGKVKPVICATYPLERAPEALEFVAGRQALGKVVITMD